MLPYRSFCLVFFLCSCCIHNFVSAQNIKNDFEGEYSQTIKPSTSESLLLSSPSIEGETPIQISKTNLEYTVPFIASFFLRGNAKAIADYLLVNDIQLLDLDNEISASNFMHVSTTSISQWTTVRYIQTHQGIPVYGTDLAITVNQDDAVTIIMGTCMNGVDLIEIGTRLTEEDVKEVVADHYVNGNVNRLNTYESNLVVFQSTEGSLLAWKINLGYREKGMTKSYEILVSDDESLVFQEINLVMFIEEPSSPTKPITTENNSTPLEEEEELSTMTPSINAQDGIRISNSRLQYSVPLIASESVKGNPKAIADYLLGNDIQLLDLDKDITSSSFMHMSTRSTSIWTTVRYIQTHQGIPVYGTELAITVNQDDVVTIVLGTYMSGLDLNDLNPILTAEDVKEIVADHYVNGNANRFNAYESELVVFQSTEGSLLAWKINLSYREKGMTKSYEVLVSDEESLVFQETNLLVSSSTTTTTSGKDTVKEKGKNLRY